MNKKLNEYTFEEIEVGMKESFQVNITESMENTFAEITGNYNPLASNEEYAATTNYKKRISPGMLTASFLSRLTVAFSTLDPVDMFSKGMSVPLHPGALKYYKEQGWMP